MNEKDIIERFFLRQHSEPSLVLGIGDDAAVIAPDAGFELVVTTDTMVEDIHFTKETKPEALGYKLMAVNLSDLAAMGAQPKWATLNLTLVEVDERWLQQFAAGLFACADKFAVTLVGGDLTRGGQINASIQLIGIVANNTALTRAGAQINDLVFVTGRLGLAASAIQKLYQHDHDHSCLTAAQYKALYNPIPRVELGDDLREIASSAIDISDGLLHELKILCDQSHLGAKIVEENIPVATGADLDLAMIGGEDYELLFTASPNKESAIKRQAIKHHCQITQLGSLQDQNGIEWLRHGNAIPLPKKTGFDHFGTK